MTWDQITIALFGALAAWLSQTRTDRLRRWACIFGMLGQPGCSTQPGRRASGAYSPCA